MFGLKFNLSDVTLFQQDNLSGQEEKVYNRPVWQLTKKLMHFRNTWKNWDILKGKFVFGNSPIFLLMVCGKCLLLYNMQEHICKKIECFVLLLNIAWLLWKIYI